MKIIFFFTSLSTVPLLSTEIASACSSW